ncbi:MAG: dihydropteroate synthase [Halanaerobiales bacterium]
MKIIGELINSSRDIIKNKIEEKDEKYLQKIAKKQEDAGADYIDINSGEFIAKEEEKLCWLVKTVQKVIDVPLSLDTANPEALKKALPLVDKKPIINSITAEKDRYDNILPLVKKYNTEVIVLCMDNRGIEDDIEIRYEIAQNLINNLKKEDISPENIFVDPILRPISINSSYGREILNLIEKLSNDFTEINITCGLSNISYGLPHRKLINQAFLLMGMAGGLNSAILDPLDPYLMSLMKAGEVLLNQDQFAQNYIKAARSGELYDISQETEEV